MTTTELMTCTARLRATPGGEITLTASEPGTTAYGPVEIAWYPDRLEITALGAGRALITKGFERRSRDVIVELRPPDLAALAETVPGAD